MKLAKPLRLLQYFWVIETAVLVLVGIILVFALPERIPAYVSMLPILGGLIVTQGGVGLAGPALKRKAEK